MFHSCMFLSGRLVFPGLVSFLSLMVLANSPWALRQVTFEGTLKNEKGEPVTGTYPYRLQYYSNDIGGTPLAAATVGEATFNERGEFAIKTTAPEPDAVAPVVWYDLLIDLDKDG